MMPRSTTEFPTGKSLLTEKPPHPLPLHAPFTHSNESSILPTLSLK